MAIRPSLLEVTVKTVVIHTITYMLVGGAVFVAFDYPRMYADPAVRLFMRQTDDPMVMLGPLIQPVRGFLFGVVFFLLRERLFQRRLGWLVMWIVLVVVGILSPFGAAPSSIEGVVYTLVPLWFHLRGLPEVIVQALLLSVGVSYWVNHPEKRWLTPVLGLLFLVALLLPLLGLLAGAVGPTGSEPIPR